MVRATGFVLMMAPAPASSCAVGGKYIDEHEKHYTFTVLSKTAFQMVKTETKEVLTGIIRDSTHIDIVDPFTSKGTYQSNCNVVNWSTGGTWTRTGSDAHEHPAVGLAVADAAAVEVGTGCWNQHAADSAGNWGWCESCDGGNLQYCCTPDKTCGCEGGKNCKCSEYNRIENLAATVEVGTGCWNQHAADSAGNWGWCENCDGGNLQYCCTPDKTYGCDGGKKCKCSEYNRIEKLFAAVEVGTGCWNQHAADSAGNWGWCESCDGGNLQYCCTPDLTSGCDGGKGCKCSSYNRLEANLMV